LSSKRLFQLIFTLVSVQLFGGCASQPVLVERPEASSGAILFRDVRVLDVATGSLSAPAGVLIEGEWIARIDAAGSLIAPARSRIVDGGGATLLPGLIDTHGHIYANPAPTWDLAPPTPERNLESYLYCGVTTVMDPSDGSGDTFSRRDRIAAGELLGPRAFVSGHALTASGGHPIAMIRVAAPRWLRWYLEPRTARQVSSPEDAREAVASLAQSGADFIKIVIDDLPPGAPTFDEGIAREIVAAAASRGLRTVAHIGSTEEARIAARAGAAAWVHGVYTERIPDEAIAELADFGIPMVATLYVFESYATLLEAKRVATPLERQTAPAELLASFNQIPEDSNLLPHFEGWLSVLRANRAHARDNVRRLRAAGVTILAGSDTQPGVFPGPGLHRELSLLTEAGLSNGDAIRAATLDPARFLTQKDDPEFGSVAVGKRADLLLVDGDPLEDLAVLSRIRHVVLGGVLLERSRLTNSGR